MAAVGTPRSRSFAGLRKSISEMGVWKCPRCERVTVSDTNLPDGAVVVDPDLCMTCIFDDEEGVITRGQE